MLKNRTIGKKRLEGTFWKNRIEVVVNHRSVKQVCIVGIEPGGIPPKGFGQQAEWQQIKLGHTICNEIISGSSGFPKLLKHSIFLF